jgi:hypothetical protein
MRGASMVTNLDRYSAAGPISTRGVNLLGIDAIGEVASRIEIIAGLTIIATAPYSAAKP